MFKVGDKGKTRDGYNYEVVSISENECVNGISQPIRAKIDNDPDLDYFCADGSYFAGGGESGFDLLPPDDTLNHYNPTWQQAVKDFALNFIETYNPANAQDIATAALDFAGDDE